MSKLAEAKARIEKLELVALVRTVADVMLIAERGNDPSVIELAEELCDDDVDADAGHAVPSIRPYR